MESVNSHYTDCIISRHIRIQSILISAISWSRLYHCTWLLYYYNMPLKMYETLINGYWLFISLNKFHHLCLIREKFRIHGMPILSATMKSAQYYLIITTCMIDDRYCNELNSLIVYSLCVRIYSCWSTTGMVLTR